MHDKSDQNHCKHFGINTKYSSSLWHSIDCKQFDYESRPICFPGHFHHFHCCRLYNNGSSTLFLIRFFKSFCKKKNSYSVEKSIFCPIKTNPKFGNIIKISVNVLNKTKLKYLFMSHIIGRNISELILNLTFHLNAF